MHLLDCLCVWSLESFWFSGQVGPHKAFEVLHFELAIELPALKGVKTKKRPHFELNACIIYPWNRGHKKVFMHKLLGRRHTKKCIYVQLLQHRAYLFQCLCFWNRNIFETSLCNSGVHKFESLIRSPHLSQIMLFLFTPLFPGPLLTLDQPRPHPVHSVSQKSDWSFSTGLPKPLVSGHGIAVLLLFLSISKTCLTCREYTQGQGRIIYSEVLLAGEGERVYVCLCMYVCMYL